MEPAAPGAANKPIRKLLGQLRSVLGRCVPPTTFLFAQRARNDFEEVALWWKPIQFAADNHAPHRSANNLHQSRGFDCEPSQAVLRVVGRLIGFGPPVGPDGVLLSQAQVLRDVVEKAVLTDGLGIDFIGIEEHHRADLAISAPEVLLAAIRVTHQTALHRQNGAHALADQKLRDGASDAVARAGYQCRLAHGIEWWIQQTHVGRKSRVNFNDTVAAAPAAAQFDKLLLADCDGLQADLGKLIRFQAKTRHNTLSLSAGARSRDPLAIVPFSLVVSTGVARSLKRFRFCRPPPRAMEQISKWQHLSS